MLGDLAAKDHRDLLRLSDGSIGVEQTLAELVQGRATAEDEVVAEFDLREEQSVSATSLFSLSCGEKRCEVRKPLLTASHQISRNERVGERLQAIGCRAFEEGIGELLESDAVLAQTIGQPMVLIEADTGGEWKVGADAHEHSSPVPVVNVKFVLNDPAISDLKMPSVRDLIANSNHDARRLAPFEDHYDCVRLGLFEILIDENGTKSLPPRPHWDSSLGRSLLHPVLKLVGDVGQGVPCHRV